MRLHLDFESRSKVDIADGLDLYARNAEVLMLAWAIDDGPVHLCFTGKTCLREMRGLAMDTVLYEKLHDPTVTKVAWNAQFERAIFLHCLGLDIPISEWYDPKLMARYANMCAHLSEACETLGLPADAVKDKEGKRLIQMFSVPIKTGKRKGEFRDPKDHPEDWERFKEYCRQDVVAERAACHELEKVYKLPEREQKIAMLDWKINERGLPVDLQYITESNALVNAEKARLMRVFEEHTGLENPNSVSQLLPWLIERGYPYKSLEEAKVKAALISDCSPEVKKALQLRLATSRSSTSKLATALTRVGPDSRIRYCYTYYGAHTGRWSGQGVQPQNLPRTEVEVGVSDGL